MLNGGGRTAGHALAGLVLCAAACGSSASGPGAGTGGTGGFDGFDFRSDADVLLKRVTLDAYYQADTLPAAAPEAQVILYDDVVVATSRIGCRVP